MTRGRAISVALMTAALLGVNLSPVEAQDAAPDAVALAAEQAQVVAATHQAIVAAAQYAVNQAQKQITADQTTLGTDQSQVTNAAAIVAASTNKLTTDQADLDQTVARIGDLDQKIAGDRTGLRAIAVGLYTGQLTNPQPSAAAASPVSTVPPAVPASALQPDGTLDADQATIIRNNEIDLITERLVMTLHDDNAAHAAAVTHRHVVTLMVGADQHALAADAQRSTGAQAQQALDRAALAHDQQVLSTTQATLVQDQADAKAALTALGTSAGNGLSVQGGAALDADQLVAWYNSEGYFDATTAPITDLVSWYLQAGAEEGVRGDIAFAQAVLETGGFSSPDAVDLNNYAGIGHCDSCASGLAFPSPQLGVLGHVQLLRTFATTTPPPPSAPPSVLDALDPTKHKQYKAGCCGTWEQLTGVWATDPAYAVHILTIYGRMLTSALAQPIPPPTTTTTAPPGVTTTLAPGGPPSGGAPVTAPP